MSCSLCLVVRRNAAISCWRLKAEDDRAHGLPRSQAGVSSFEVLDGIGAVDDRFQQTLRCEGSKIVERQYQVFIRFEIHTEATDGLLVDNDIHEIDLGFFPSSEADGDQPAAMRQYAQHLSGKRAAAGSIATSAP